MWSVEETTSTRTALVVAGRRQVREQLLEHLGVDRVAGLGPLEAQQRDAVPRRRRRWSALSSASLLGRDLGSTRRSVSSAARCDQLARPRSSGSRKRDEDVGGDDLGVGRVGPPDAAPHPPEVGAAEPCAEALQAVVAGDAAAELGADLAERQVDLVVDDDDAARAAPSARRAPGPPSSPDSFM